MRLVFLRLDLVFIQDRWKFNQCPPSTVVHLWPLLLSPLMAPTSSVLIHMTACWIRSAQTVSQWWKNVAVRYGGNRHIGEISPGCGAFMSANFPFYPRGFVIKVWQIMSRKLHQSQTVCRSEISGPELLDNISKLFCFVWLAIFLLSGLFILFIFWYNETVWPRLVLLAQKLECEVQH